MGEDKKQREEANSELFFPSVVAASRVAFAYARDDCFGSLSKPLKRVNQRTLTPVNAVWFNAVVGILLLLLVFGGAAIDAIFSIGAIAAYVAFTTPIFIKIVFVGNRFRRGPVSKRNVAGLLSDQEVTWLPHPYTYILPGCTWPKKCISIGNRDKLPAPII